MISTLIWILIIVYIADQIWDFGIVRSMRDSLGKNLSSDSQVKKLEERVNELEEFYRQVSAKPFQQNQEEKGWVSWEERKKQEDK